MDFLKTCLDSPIIHGGPTKLSIFPNPLYSYGKHTVATDPLVKSTALFNLIIAMSFLTLAASYLKWQNQWTKTLYKGYGVAKGPVFCPVVISGT